VGDEHAEGSSPDTTRSAPYHAMWFSMAIVARWMLWSDRRCSGRTDRMTATQRAAVSGAAERAAKGGFEERIIPQYMSMTFELFLYTPIGFATVTPSP